ncbi:SusC/RagA family TonB-linked outer membrane protein [Sesbania bispinosa]|nr:SusC/RagA family TonB-linked outer membrane protein [Sesbania bispinosa]
MSLVWSLSLDEQTILSPDERSDADEQKGRKLHLRGAYCWRKERCHVEISMLSLEKRLTLGSSSSHESENTVRTRRTQNREKKVVGNHRESLVVGWWRGEKSM